MTDRDRRDVQGKVTTSALLSLVAGGAALAWALSSSQDYAALRSAIQYAPAFAVFGAFAAGIYTPEGASPANYRRAATQALAVAVFAWIGCLFLPAVAQSLFAFSVGHIGLLVYRADALRIAREKAEDDERFGVGVPPTLIEHP